MPSLHSTSDFLKRKTRRNVALPNRLIQKAAQIKIRENITRTEEQIPEDVVKKIVSLLRSHFIFFALSPEQLEIVAKSMFCCEGSKDEFIFRQGDDASLFFYLD